jgi:DNA-binding IclR family transcriptional regulator
MMQGVVCMSEAVTTVASRAAPRFADYRVDAPQRVAPLRPMVAPFARAIALLCAFTPDDRWLSNGGLALRTGLPASTVTRLARSLVLLGYLLHEPVARKYRLSAAVLALGHGASAGHELQRTARARMQAFAERHGVHVNLSSRDGLELVVLESCETSHSRLSLNLRLGGRVGIASSPLGWAMLGALKEPERDGLLAGMERRMPRDWSLLRRRATAAIATVREQGYCSALTECRSDLGIVATPVLVDGSDPLVLACIGSSATFNRVRVESELGPRLLAMARALQDCRENR